jgi:subtilisin family serine protease
VRASFQRRAAITGALVLAIAAPARSEPTVASGQRISADIVVCGNWLDCGLASWIAPVGWIDPKRQIVVDGTGGAVPKLTLDVIGSGEIGGNPLPASAVSVNGVPRMSGTVAIVSLAIVGKDLPPDHYLGTLRVGGDATPADVPVDLRVRRGPFGPTVWLLVGILLGFLAKFWSERGAKESRVLTDLDLLAGTAANMSTEDGAILTVMLQDAREQVMLGRVDDADQELEKIRKRRGQLVALRALEGSLPGDPEIATARDMVRRGQDTDAAEAIAALQQRANAGGARTKRAEGRSAIARRPVASRRARLWIVQHVLPRFVWGAVVIGLLLIGLNTLYVQGGATFGAQPLYDHLVLILWGLGTEVTSRNLSNLSGLLGQRVAASATPSGVAAPNTSAVESAKGVHVPPFEIVPAPDETPRERTQWPKDHLDTQALITKHRTGDGVRVAVVDSGVDFGQTAIDRARVEVLDIRPNGDGHDDYGHGTCMVALVASALGVCPDATIVSIRVLDSQGAASADDLVAGIELALAKQCDVISISAGQSSADDKLAAAVTKAQNAGAVVVAAVLNKKPHSAAYPASLPGCVGVTPTDPSDKLFFDSAPPWVTCGAPGVSIPTFGRNGRVLITGSSPATALAAGTCAMLLQAKPRGPSRTALARGLAPLIRQTGKQIDGARRFAPIAADKEIEG